MAFPNRIHLLEMRQSRGISVAQEKRAVRQLNHLDQKAQVIFSADRASNGGSESTRIYFAPDPVLGITDLAGVEINHTSLPIDARHPLIPYELCGVTYTRAARPVAKIWRFNEEDFRLPVGYTIAVCIFPSGEPPLHLPEFELGYHEQIPAQEFRLKLERLFAPLKLPNLLDLSWAIDDCSVSTDNTTIRGRNDEYTVVVRQDYFY